MEIQEERKKTKSEGKEEEEKSDGKAGKEPILERKI